MLGGRRRRDLEQARESGGSGEWMRVALEVLEPEWIAGARDWGIGASFLCWECGRRHAVIFQNGCGGYESSVPDAQAYYREGTSFSTLTLSPTVEIPGCFRGWLGLGIFWVAEH